MNQKQCLDTRQSISDSLKGSQLGSYIRKVSRLCHRTNLPKSSRCSLYFATKTKNLTTKQVVFTRYDVYINNTSDIPFLK